MKVYVYQEIRKKHGRENPIEFETEVFTSKDKALSKLEDEYDDLMVYYEDDIYEEDVVLEEEEGVIKAHRLSREERGFSILIDLFVIEKEVIE